MVRRFIGEEDAFVPEMATIVPVVAISAAIASLALVPVARWALKLGPARVEAAAPRPDARAPLGRPRARETVHHGD